MNPQPPSSLPAALAASSQPMGTVPYLGLLAPQTFGDQAGHQAQQWGMATRAAWAWTVSPSPLWLSGHQNFIAVPGH